MLSGRLCIESQDVVSHAKKIALHCLQFELSPMSKFKRKPCDLNSSYTLLEFYDIKYKCILIYIISKCFAGCKNSYSAELTFLLIYHE